MIDWMIIWVTFNLVPLWHAHISSPKHIALCAGDEEQLRERGVEVTLLDLPAAKQMMSEFIRAHPALWQEDLGGLEVQPLMPPSGCVWNWILRLVAFNFILLNCSVSSSHITLCCIFHGTPFRRSLPACKLISTFELIYAHLTVY